VDPHIFADPDPGSQNLTDPDKALIGNVYPKYRFNNDLEFPFLNWKSTYRVTFKQPTVCSTTFPFQFKFFFSIFFYKI